MQEPDGNANYEGYPPRTPDRTNQMTTNLSFPTGELPNVRSPSAYLAMNEGFAQNFGGIYGDAPPMRNVMNCEAVGYQDRRQQNDVERRRVTFKLSFVIMYLLFL